MSSLSNVELERLERSAVVANNAMNRERGLDGVNSYAKELGFHPLDLLAPGQSWLDLCCGSGRALIEASHRAELHGPARCRLVLHHRRQLTA